LKQIDFVERKMLKRSATLNDEKNDSVEIFHQEPLFADKVSIR
jgi:hypothetical protein